MFNFHHHWCCHTDNTPPRVVSCPAEVNAESFQEDLTTFATWKEPQFADNSDEELTVVKTRGPSVFSNGIETVTYTAIDRAKNTANCSFVVTVIKMSEFGCCCCCCFCYCCCTKTNRTDSSASLKSTLRCQILW